MTDFTLSPKLRQKKRMKGRLWLNTSFDKKVVDGIIHHSKEVPFGKKFSKIRKKFDDLDIDSSYDSQ